MTRQAELVEQIIPYIAENFITFPLWEEGDYAPTVNMWRFFKNNEELDAFTNENWQTDDIGVLLEINDSKVIENLGAEVDEDGEIEMTYDETGEVNYNVTISIYYHEQNHSTDFEPLLEVAAKIATFKVGQ